MRSADEHLTPQEIDQLLFGADDSKDNAGGGVAPEAQQHLSGCAVCQSVADKYRNIDSAIKGLRTDDNRALKASTRGADCPAVETWPNLAAGLIREDQAARYVSHAAQCDWCGPLLKESMEDLAQPVTAEEQEALDRLPSASPGWQRAMAKKMAAASVDADVPLVEVETPAWSKEPKSNEKAGFSWWPKLVWAGSGLAVFLVALLVGIRLTREPDVNQLLAQAYTEQRTIELRMPGAKYGPTRITRGKEHSSLNRPTSLLDAESIIRHSLDKYPNDPEWLDKKGRAELLDGDYSSAIATLRRAKDLSAAPALALDLATAYFERAEAEGGAKSNEDYQSALALLNIVLQQNSNDRIALFNRAIVQERMGLPEAAVKDWDKYLSFPGDDDWKEEARKHLLVLQEKLKKSEEYDQPLMDFSTFARTVSAANTASWQAADPRIEDYLEQSVSLWLPAAFSPQETESRRKEAFQALQTLAEILAQRHGDYWLRDVLKPAHSPEYTAAVLSLGEALKAEAAGDPEGAARKAKEADALFRAAGNLAGSTRARAELVYALHRSVQGHRCEAAAELLEKDIDPKLNPWLRGQVLIEHSICAGMVGHLARSQAEIPDALVVTKKAAYPQLYLRALGIAASLDTEMGRPDAAWNKDRAGLTIYWSGSYSPQRAYQFYSDMGFFPEKSRQWSVALVLAREAAFQAIRTHNPSTEALARFRLANAASAAGSPAEAIAEFEVAGKIYENLPQDRTTRTYLLDGEISLAELKILNGEWDVLLKNLADAERQLSTISDYSIPLRLYVVLGEMYSRQGRWADARAAYVKAVLISEHSLKNLHEEAERLRWDRETGTAYHGLLKSYLQQREDAAGALEFWEWYKVAASRPAALRQVQVSKQDALLVNVKASAKPVHALYPIFSSLKKEVILAYVQFPDEIISWTFDDRGVRFVRVPVAAADFELTATRFLDQCSDPKSSLEALQANGRKLYDWLIAPQIHNLRSGDQLTIEPDGAIAKVPFAALVDENGKYLAERFALTFSPGAHYRSARRMDLALSTDQKVLIVAPPAFTSQTGLKPLPEALQEADAVASRFHHPLRLTGREATLEAVERALGNAEIFHYVGHSYGNLGSFGLLLASKDQTPDSGQESAILTAERISRLNLHRLRLVVLSSCSTESDPDQVLTDPDELVRAFLHAGAKQVIASRWNVDSGVTENLIKGFYERVLWPASSIHALRRAAAQIKEEGNTSHPYFWAPLCVFKY